MTLQTAFLGRVLIAESKAEFLKVLRLPAFVVPTLFFPVMFYVLFALTFGAGRTAGSLSYSAYMLATYGSFGVMGAALVGVGIGIAMERGQGWLVVKRASPMPPVALFLAKGAMSMIFAGLIAGLLFMLGATMGGVQMPLARWAGLAVALMLGAVPFCAMGCALGFLAGPNSAPAIANLLYLPMAFASGLWIPIEMLPRVFQKIAPFLPPYHLSQLALGIVDGTRKGFAMHLGALGVFTAIFVIVGVIAYRRDEGKTYG
jgi:ABC-2 type transport system permease protein